METVLVTGGAGYIGSVLVETLLQAGHAVVVLDRMFFGNNLRHLLPNDQLTVVQGDIRTYDLGLLPRFSAVMDLAAISNDPAGELDPAKTLEINFQGRARVAAMAKKIGVKRYILASSCSIYGFQEGVLDETSTVNPLTTYASANFKAEKAAFALADDRFCVTALRQATVYGLSPRMRFDLAVNGMTLGLVQNGQLPILRDGTQWRPMVHVKDTSRAFLTVLESDPAIVSGQVYNVGCAEQNYQIMPLAKTLAKALGMPFVYEWYGEPDHRSYQVDFSKIANGLGFVAEHTVGEAANDIRRALDDRTVVADDRTRTVVWYKKLLEWNERLAGIVVDGRVL